jgi:vacuolar-type H+-ATPase subunit H
LQDLWSAVDTTSQHGLDALAATMNAGGKLATDELRTAYSQVAIDLKTSLAEVDAELLQSMAEANKAYSEAMTEAKTVRDEALADAQKTLTDALVKAQKEYETAIDEINKATQKKLDELQAKLREVSALMAALGAAQAAAAAMASAPVSSPFVTSGEFNSMGGVGRGEYGPSSSITVNNAFNSSTPPNPNTVSQAAVSGIKYGAAIVPTSNFTYGAGNPKSPVYVAPSAQIKNRARGD